MPESTATRLYQQAAALTGQRRQAIGEAADYAAILRRFRARLLAHPPRQATPGSASESRTSPESSLSLEQRVAALEQALQATRTTLFETTVRLLEHEDRLHSQESRARPLPADSDLA